MPVAQSMPPAEGACSGAHLQREGAQRQAGDGVARGDNVEVAGALNALAEEHGDRVAVLHDLGVADAAQAQELHAHMDRGKLKADTQLLLMPRAALRTAVDWLRRSVRHDETRHAQQIMQERISDEQIDHDPMHDWKCPTDLVVLRHDLGSALGEVQREVDLVCTGGHTRDTASDLDILQSMKTRQYGANL